MCCRCLDDKIPPGNEHTHKQTKRGMRREKERERKRKSFFARKQTSAFTWRPRSPTRRRRRRPRRLGQSRTQVCSFPFFLCVVVFCEAKTWKIQKFFSSFEDDCFAWKNSREILFWPHFLRIKHNYDSFDNTIGDTDESVFTLIIIAQ